MSAATEEDGFDRLLGTRRGRTDLDGLCSLVAHQEAELHELRADRAATKSALAQSQEALADAEGKARRQAFALTRLRGRVVTAEHDLVRLRYALLRVGRRDRLNPVAEEFPFGVWTPGRPYLPGEHAYHPRTGRCFAARAGGALVGERPGDSRRWARCYDPGHPEATVVLHSPPAPIIWFVLRQDAWWWDQDSKRCALGELTDENLARLIASLRERAPTLYHDELVLQARSAPCPVVAYSTSRSWLADTPLTRALLAERRRRGLRHSGRPVSVALE